MLLLEAFSVLTYSHRSPRAAGAYGLRHLAANCSLVASFVQTAAVLQGSLPLV
jgi:hypothetical protein